MSSSSFIAPPPLLLACLSLPVNLMIQTFIAYLLRLYTGPLIYLPWAAISFTPCKLPNARRTLGLTPTARVEPPGVVLIEIRGPPNIDPSRDFSYMSRNPGAKAKSAGTVFSFEVTVTVSPATYREPHHAQRTQIRHVAATPDNDKPLQSPI